VMERDPVTSATPLLNGVVVQQHTPTGGFTNSSLNGNMVISLTGLSMCSSAPGAPKAGAGLLTANGSGAFSLTYDENFCRAPNSFTDAPGRTACPATGVQRLRLEGSTWLPYLVNLNQIFLFVSISMFCSELANPRRRARSPIAP